MLTRLGENGLIQHHPPSGPGPWHREGDLNCDYCHLRRELNLRHSFRKRNGRWYMRCPQMTGGAYLDILPEYQDWQFDEVAVMMERHIKQCPALLQYKAELSALEMGPDPIWGNIEYSKRPKILPPITTDSGMGPAQTTLDGPNSTWSSAAVERIKKWFA